MVCRMRKVDGEEAKDWREVWKVGRRAEGECIVRAAERNSLEVEPLICSGRVIMERLLYGYSVDVDNAITDESPYR